jgi:phosphatidylglycerol:prolipoprotein diacylglycerol transferase
MAMHALFDGLAWFTAALTALLVNRWRGTLLPPSPFKGDRLHLLVLLGGAGFGAYLFGSLNLWISGEAGIARSVEGALAGAIVAVELYKRHRGISGRSSALYALPVALGIAVGRIGCFLAGMDDFTYGTPTSLPWGHDFGDGVMRHPVQLYETGLMGLFALVYVVALGRRSAYFAANGFALVVLYYAVQRFGLEFLKPYAPLIFGLTLFQLLSICLSLYAIAILWDRKPVHA